jgi:Arylsulfotransferase (ASST)
MPCVRRLIVSLTVAAGMSATLPGLSPADPARPHSAPLCTPASLDDSALLDGAVTVSPLPGSRDATPQTQISFLGVPAGALRAISVVGSRSGRHAGRLRAYSQGDGASFLPARPFAEGERVTVSAQLLTGRLARRLLDRFAVAVQDRISSTPEAIHPGSAAEQQYFRSRPDLRPPVVTVTSQSPAVAPGDEFVAPYSGPGQAGPMILDPRGGLVWFKPLAPYQSATDLRVQQYAGKPVLTWWQGDISVHGYGLGEGVIADQSYDDIAHVRAGNGLQADLHELQLTPQGTALISAYDPISCDLAAAGGSADGAVTDSALQEIDVRTGLVMMQWTSLDHVALGESYERARDSTPASPFDFFHLNSIGATPGATLLVSARNTWTVYGVDARSGQIAWRLGGKHSTFALGAGTQTAWQHDARELPGGQITIFDNGASPPIHHQSRGIVVSLDAQRRTATLLAQLLHPSPLVADSQGDLQALPNGDWFVGWGQVPDFSELGPAGQLLFDAHFPPHDQSYRSLRFTWTGTPAHAPAFTIRPGPHGGGAVYASWNGSTLLAAWRVLAGPVPTALTPVAEAPRSGFETEIGLPGTVLGPYLTVQALSASGTVLATAATKKL